MAKKILISPNGKIITSNTGTILYNDTAPAPVYPTKGQLITMELGNSEPVTGVNNLYRVLNIQGSIAEIVAMYEAIDTEFASNYDNDYADSTLDAYFNTTFYNSLNSEAKTAIVTKNIIQYKYVWDADSYDPNMHASYADYSTKDIRTLVGNRYVYVLDIEDIETYFNSVFSKRDLAVMFMSDQSITPISWLRSARIESEMYESWGLSMGGRFC